MGFWKTAGIFTIESIARTYKAQIRQGKLKQRKVGLTPSEEIRLMELEEKYAQCEEYLKQNK